jgi:hypothetical protein
MLPALGRSIVEGKDIPSMNIIILAMVGQSTNGGLTVTHFRSVKTSYGAISQPPFGTLKVRSCSPPARGF